MISVLILTFNEENIIRNCIESVSWSDDIIVFDSFSTDKTVQIAESLGARVFKRKFDNENTHRHESLKLDFKHDWVYNPDADEITEPRLAEEILSTISKGPNHVAYQVRFKVMMGKYWMRNSSMYPTWIVRLFKPKHISFKRSINLNYIIDGSQGRLKNHILHYTFNKGFYEWFAKHNIYSSHEAHETIKFLTSSDKISIRNLFLCDSRERRKAIKEISYFLPFRYIFRFLYLFLIRRGFLDGRMAIQYCMLITFYEFMIYSKVLENRYKLSFVENEK